MKFEVCYSDKTYGNGYDVSRYKIIIEKKRIFMPDWSDTKINIRYKFNNAVSGKSESSWACVEEGRMVMSKQEALNLAHGLISFLYMEREYDEFIIEND